MIRCLRYLLIIGLFVLTGCRNDENVLLRAVWQNDLSKVESVLSHSKNIKGYSKKGVSPLMVAAFTGNSKIVDLLLSHGADPNHVTIDGITPIYAAAWNARVDIAQTLVKAGAIINISDRSGQNPLMCACSGNNDYLVECLHYALGNRSGTLYERNFRGREKVVKLLLDRGARVEALDNEGRTALMYAIDGGRIWSRISESDGHTKIIELLITYGADLKIMDMNGKTAVDYAQEYGLAETVRILQKLDNK